MKILIAEDDQNITTIMGITLEQVGDHHVHVVENGQKALDVMEIQTFDLLLLDAMMPVKNGIETCKELKIVKKNNTPVIFLTAKTDEASVAEFLSIGAIGVIGKPFDPSKICDQIDEVLSKNGLLAC